MRWKEKKTRSTEFNFLVCAIKLIELDINFFIAKHYSRVPKPESLCASDEQGELGKPKRVKAIEDRPDIIESRGVELGHEIFQVLATTPEFKLGENGKDCPHQGIRVPCPLFRGRNPISESNAKGLEPGQHGKTCNHRLW